MTPTRNDFPHWIIEADAGNWHVTYVMYHKSMMEALQEFDESCYSMSDFESLTIKKVTGTLSENVQKEWG